MLLRDDISAAECDPDVRLNSPEAEASAPMFSHEQCPFLSFVKISDIPLYMIIGRPLCVSSSTEETQRWFRETLGGTDLSPSCGDPAQWWRNVDSPVGLLVSARGAADTLTNGKMKATELLFYVSRTSVGFAGAASPPETSSVCAEKTQVFALALSSQALLPIGSLEPTTPPASPPASYIEAVFVPHPWEIETVHEPPTRKRKSVTDAFDEASARRQTARRKGGQGVSAMAATNPEPQRPSLKHRQSSSMSQPAPLPVAPPSRPSSVASPRPGTAASVAGRRSNLSQPENVSNASEENSVASRNKETISRITLAGMRLRGLYQNKSRQKVHLSGRESEPTEKRDQDEEYKLVYHQVYKGVCFAFRKSIGRELLQPRSDAVREVVDKLLAIFCTDPLVRGASERADYLDAGAQGAFASCTQQAFGAVLGGSS